MKLLVIAPAWIGDMVMSSCLYQRLAATHDALELHVAAPASTAPLAERMPEVARVHVLPFAHGRLDVAARWRLGRALAIERFDGAIVLPNSWKSALPPFAARIARRTGFTGEARLLLLNDRRTLDPATLPRMVDRFFSLGGEGSAPAPRDCMPHLRGDPERARDLVRSFGLDAQAPVIAICPGAEYGPSKRWPPGHFADVVRRSIDDGGQAWIIGSPADTAAAREVRDALPAASRARAFDLTGRTRLLDAVDLLSLADRVVANDSGLMHIAAALGRAVVGVFGSTTAAFTPPLGARARSVSLGLPCSPCFARDCPLGHGDCLKRLAPDRVIAELDALSTPDSQ